MEAKEFRKMINKVSTPKLYKEFESVLSKHGLKNVEVTGFSVAPLFEITNKTDCIRAGRKWVCRDKNDPNKNSRCYCEPKAKITD